MEFSASFLAFGKLAVTFCLILALLRLRAGLWQAITAGSAFLALSCGLGLFDWLAMFAEILRQKEFLIICLMVFLILLLSSVLDSTGQNRRLVEALEKRLHRPRVRLVLFPALIGMLPMPGGALFSCPMLKTAARDMPLSEHKMALINYWFRHIWELSWPLYPGYVLACSILDIPLSRLWQLTFPLLPFAFAVGWFFFMRDPLPARFQAHEPATLPPEGASPGAPAAGSSLYNILMLALPIIVALAGSALFIVLCNALLPALPSPLSFSLALLCAIVVALRQGRGHRERSLSKLIFAPHSQKILLLLYVIFLFKHSVTQSGLLQTLGNTGAGSAMVIASFIALPFIAGMLTGIMVGYVGVAFPILIGILSQSPLREHAVPLVILGLAAGNAGQMLSPLHVCLVVTCEFFSTPVTGVLRAVCAPAFIMLCGGALWALAALALGLHW